MVECRACERQAESASVAPNAQSGRRIDFQNPAQDRTLLGRQLSDCKRQRLFAELLSKEKKAIGLRILIYDLFFSITGSWFIKFNKDE